MDYFKIKRAIDIFLSAAGMAVFFPVLLITAVAVKLDSEGPMIFSQERLGLNGRKFRMYKFRSMYAGAEKEGVYERKGDSRVTKTGRFIRATSIDELPQFINIIKGEMSLIGPRPVLAYHPWPLDEYTVQQRKRFSVRPGVTGWAQVNGRKGLLWEKRIEYDVEYVEHISFILDLKIFLKTLIRVVTAHNNINTGETASKSH